MRLPLLAAALAALTAACTGAPSPQPAPPPATTAPSSTAAAPLGWGDTGTSSGVTLTVAAPKAAVEKPIGVDGQPVPGQRYVQVDVTVDNQAPGPATLSVTGRIGGQETSVVEAGDGDGPPVAPGETVVRGRLVRVPAAGPVELALQVYANVPGAATRDRLLYIGQVP